MKICIVLGTRPEIIKACSLIRYCQKQSINFFLIHTGQHYSHNLDKLFFDDLGLPEPKYNLQAGGGPFKMQLSSMLPKIKSVLGYEKPDVVLVIGDTNSVLAGGLAASQLGISLGHVEAGLRSNDIMMLEETHRIIVDNIADFLFTPTNITKKNLVEENHPSSKIFITGNTIVDALEQNVQLTEHKSTILDNFSLSKGAYIVVASHRQENVDVKKRLTSMLEGISLVYENYKLPIIWPIHPRTVKMIEKFNIQMPEGITTIPPLGYLDFLLLQRNAHLIMTDSGGMQEESCILKVPCITLRDNTERPETILVGSNILVGVNPHKILQGAKNISSKERNWQNPYGDGKAAEKIVKILQEYFR
jgi:UDP-N-acetylglucosamine 2-epimerase (non-hydrolysing)